ncbi:MAG: glycosyltransferase family 2 protein [Candidatus Brocadiia bacterium]
MSVIIPTYNRAHFITDAMDSVWNQTYRPIELIVVDDGSTDDTSEVVEKWCQICKDDKQFQVRHLHQSNKGPPAARNLGLIASRGEYIQYLDSDDILGRAKIAANVAALVKGGISKAAYSPWKLFRATEDAKYAISAASRGIDGSCVLSQWIKGSFIPPHAILWRRETVRQLGPWHETSFRNDDGEYACRFMILGGRFEFCPRGCVYYRREGADHISSERTSAAARARLRAAKRLQNMLGRRDMLTRNMRRALACHYFRIARSAAESDRKAAMECFRRILRLRIGHPAGMIARIIGARATVHLTAQAMRLLWTYRRVMGGTSFKAERHVTTVRDLMSSEDVN